MLLLHKAGGVIWREGCDDLERDDDDVSDLRPKTFWEKHGFKVILALFAVACFAAGYMLR